MKEKIFIKFAKKTKKIFFNFENIEFKTNKDIEKIEEYLISKMNFSQERKAQLQNLKKKFLTIQVGR